MAAGEQKEGTIFIALIMFTILAVIAAAFMGLLFNPLTILMIILVITLVTYTQSRNFFLQLQEYERAVIFRRGKFKKVVGPGWIFLTPFIESYRQVDLRVKTADIPSQDVVTKDNINLKFDAIMYIKVVDPKKAILNIEDYHKAAVLNIQASLRAVVGQIPLSEVISNINKINDLLKKANEKVASGWGIEIENVEIQSIIIPDSVQKEMHKLKEAEQKKLAARELAEGKRIQIEAIQAAGGKLTGPTLQYMYLQSLNKIAEGKSSKLIFPMELSRLAQGISAKFHEPYDKAQNEIVSRYQELHSKGMSQNKIIKTLMEEYGISKAKVSKKDVEEAKPFDLEK